MFRAATRCVMLGMSGTVLAAALAQPGEYLNRLPAGERWVTHLTRDLLPFWTMRPALGSPLGAFPSVRCDDGSLLDYKNPCPPVAGNSYLLAPAQYLVS